MSHASGPLPNHADFQQTIWRRRMRWLRIWLVVSCLVLVGSTWKLWTPQTVFPQIPFLAALRTAPPWIDWFGLAVMLIALIAMLMLALVDRRRPAAAGRDVAETHSSVRFSATPSREREGLRAKAASLLFVSALALLVLLDQHRFQPWAYQFAIVAIVLAYASAGRAASLLRVLTVGIYFWSAVSKLDYTFLHGLGPELLRGLLTALHLEPGWMRPEVAATLAWAFPLDELAIAVLLAIRKTRPLGLVGAIGMHVLLLATLGPFGLNHSPGVLLWNVYFIGQDVLIFWRPEAGWKAAAGPDARRRFRDILTGLVSPSPSVGIARVAVFVAVWLPILRPFGYLDYWPAWAVYAPAAERVTLYCSDPAKEPDSNRAGLPDFELELAGTWHLRDSSWSLDAIDVPLYPEGRFRVGIAQAVIDRYDLGDASELLFSSRADRWTGKRVYYEVKGAEAIREYASSFRLNALPRELGGW